MRGSCATSAESWRSIRRPVALPPACTTRRTECPPSRPSARRPKRSASKRTPSDCSSRTHSGASRTRTSAAVRRTAPRPARSVSRRCSSGLSSLASAAAEPALRPVARRLRQRRRRDQHHLPARARRAQRRVEARRAGADDRHVRLQRTVRIGPRPPSRPAMPLLAGQRYQRRGQRSQCQHDHEASPISGARQRGVAARRVRAAAPQPRHHSCSPAAGFRTAGSSRAPDAAGERRAPLPDRPSAPSVRRRRRRSRALARGRASDGRMISVGRVVRRGRRRGARGGRAVRRRRTRGRCGRCRCRWCRLARRRGRRLPRGR